MPVDRNACAAEVVKTLGDVSSILDIGCREGGLRPLLPESVSYDGADLFPVGDHVTYVGDFQDVEIDRTFSTVVALDVLEHMEFPSKAFDKIAGLADRHIIASLPNCYDLKSRWRFAMHGRLGGKYDFSTKDDGDRHRWVMGLGEIEAFFQEKASMLGFSLRLEPLRYGRGSKASFRNFLGKAIGAVSPPTLSADTVLAVLERQATQAAAA